MQTTYSVQHMRHISDRSFDAVVAAFEEATGSIENPGFTTLFEESTSRADFESKIHAQEKSSGFMRFLTIDHGVWMKYDGVKSRAILYIMGNPLVARTMLKHTIAAGLNVPIRLTIYEDEKSGKTNFEYDSPSSLMSVFENEDVNAAAKKLDQKLIALAKEVTGADA